MALQDGDSITGDHELVPLKGAKFTLQTGKFHSTSFKKNTSGVIMLMIVKSLKLIHPL